MNKKILIYYFTGTYNTRYMVMKLKEQLLSQGAEKVDIEDITDLTKLPHIAHDQYDIIGFSYPIHAFNTPKNFHIFVRDLDIKDKPFFIVKDSREVLSLNNASSCKIIKFLKKKGCNLLSEYHLLMPYNIHFRHDDRLVKQMLLKMDEKMPNIANDIINNKKVKFRRGLIARITAFLFRIEWKGAKTIGKGYVTNDKCVMCKKCVNTCPNHNIEVITNNEGKLSLKFNDNCMICMRCVLGCPSDAIDLTIYKKWKVNGVYNFKAILEDPSITPDYITPKSKGYLSRSYKKYFFDKK